MNPFRYIESKLNALAAFLLKGTEDNYPLRFALREALHFTGGALIGLVPVLTTSRVFSILAGLLLTAIIVYKEVREDKVSQPRYKTVVDVIAWVAGFLAPTLIYYLIIK